MKITRTLLKEKLKSLIDRLILISTIFCQIETTQDYVHLTVYPSVVTYFFCFRMSQINISLCHFIWYSVSMTVWFVREQAYIYFLHLTAIIFILTARNVKIVQNVCHIDNQKNLKWPGQSFMAGWQSQRQLKLQLLSL